MVRFPVFATDEIHCVNKKRIIIKNRYLVYIITIIKQFYVDRSNYSIFMHNVAV